METQLLRIFQNQVADQCRVALHGVGLLESGLRQPSVDTIWVGIQILITGSGNVGKALWGSGRTIERTSTERIRLRESLGIADTSSLREIALRNHFEHFDKRLDKWWNRSSSHN